MIATLNGKKVYWSQESMAWFDVDTNEEVGCSKVPEICAIESALKSAERLYTAKRVPKPYTSDEAKKRFVRGEK